MPCPHNEISIVQRSQQQSAIAAAAYQSGEKLFCEYDQQVFCDISTPKTTPSQRAAKASPGTLDSPEIRALESAISLEESAETPFTVYEDVRQKLIDAGMPPEQIAFILPTCNEKLFPGSILFLYALLQTAAKVLMDDVCAFQAGELLLISGKTDAFLIFNREFILQAVFHIR